MPGDVHVLFCSDSSVEQNLCKIKLIKLNYWILYSFHLDMGFLQLPCEVQLPFFGKC